MNCRMVKVTEFEGKAIDDFKKCSEIQGLSYNWLKKEMLNQGGICRWAGGRESAVEEEGRGVCLCPATTEKLCTKGRASGYFHTDRKTNEKTCISKPERFYNQLARLLSKRGKKDFSMKIQYGGSGARGYLPMGLQGPSLIGARLAPAADVPPRRLRDDRLGRAEERRRRAVPGGVRRRHHLHVRVNLALHVLSLDRLARLRVD